MEACLARIETYGERLNAVVTLNEGALDEAREAEALAWADVAERVGRSVADGPAEQGLLFCWTGTGVSMAANKVPGVRAALCGDAETARGARRWNDANVLCLSLRATSEVIAKEILDAWFEATPDASEAENIEKVRALDRGRKET
ncbi:MAG: RpiB/LacA/LacB family sugar-phosphate isomerase [Proteobacteria bacterium]|nr:RpiB/LacA/LacB family sugar-phosphate isomerase [Pseudomonadota bacterium]